MASTYTPLGIEKMATGENAGTWGTKTNANLQILNKYLVDLFKVSILVIQLYRYLTDLQVQTLAHRMIEFTGSLTGNRIVTIPNDVQNFYILKNSTSGSQNVVFKYAIRNG